MTPTETGLLQGWLIPGGIGAGMAFLGTLLSQLDAGERLRREYRENGAIIGSALLFWPISVILIALWACLVAVKRVAPQFAVFDKGDRTLSRRQRRQLEFERQRNVIAAENNRIQEEFNHLITRQTALPPASKEKKVHE